ncbi:glutathione transferase GstA [Rhodovibrionaceae bacterium A322]
MKLYYIPGACSLASHITLNELGAEFDLVQVNAEEKRTANGEDFLEINPNGYVPALIDDEGDVFTESAAVLQYLADLKPAEQLAPAAGSRERVRLQQYLNYISSELHKAFGPFFSGQDLSDDAKDAAVKNVSAKLGYLESLLADGRHFLLGDRFSVADAYAFVVSSWAVPTGIGLSRWPMVAAFVERVAARPQVVKAMRAEGLLA